MIDQIAAKISEVAPHIKKEDAIHMADVIQRISTGRRVLEATLFGSSSVGEGKDIDIFIGRGEKEATPRLSLVGMEYPVPPETGTKWLDITERDWTFETSVRAGEAIIFEGHKAFTIYENNDIGHRKKERRFFECL